MEQTGTYVDDTASSPDMNAEPPGTSEGAKTIPEKDRNLVKQILQTIKADKKHHDKAFKRMHRDMQVAMWGAEETWGEANYRANIIGRHIKSKVASLYAKNPKAVARRRETLDFAMWDENPKSLELAFMTIQTATAMAQQEAANPQAIAPDPMGDPMGGPPIGDPMGDPMGAPDQMMPQNVALPPGLEQAQALIADFQQGMQRRTMLAKYGKTLEVLFADALRKQKPVDFKRAMKQLVRRACTTGVGYAELGFQRETGARPGLTEELADARQRLDHLKNLAQQVQDGEITEDDGEMAELERAMAQLQAEPEIVLREGLIIDFPPSTKVIPDRLTKYLDGFIGARHLTIEYTYSKDEVKELFGVDLTDKYTAYTQVDGTSRVVGANDVTNDDYEWGDTEKKKNGLVCVWKHYDKPSGLVYFVADGYEGFLREPAAPDVFVEEFWPVFALTFNAVESEKELFPPSDVALLLDMQKEYNRSRQGMREHRDAARPRWIYPNGVFDEEDSMMMRKLKPFEALGVNIDPQTKMSDVLQAFPVPGVDPNLYETNQLFTDIQLVGGAQEAQYGGVSQSTATEATIAANATHSADGSAVDDLDGFLTSLARASGQILQREMSEEKVKEIVGPGYVWPELTLAEIAGEVFLEVEAGSSGKPNQAIEINNWKQMLPLLIQMPNIDPTWLARETLKRLDDRMDLTEALASGIPSIIQQNQQTQPNMADAGGNPNQQGGEGMNNAPKPPGQAGSSASFGSNQVGQPGR